MVGCGARDGVLGILLMTCRVALCMRQLAVSWPEAREKVVYCGGHGLTYE